MQNHKQKTKKTFNSHPNYVLCFIFVGLGLFVEVLAHYNNFDNLKPLFNTGIAVTIVLAAVPIFIQEYLVYRNWKSENLLRHTILDVLMFEQIEAMRNIRYRQSIMLTIDPCEYRQRERVETFLKVTCVHEYTYKNESLVKKNINIDIFNDIFIPPSKVQTNSQYQRTDFNWVKLLYKSGKEEMYRREDNSEYFKKLPDGRPHFQKNISLNSKDEVTLTYSIKNEFELFSRLVWNIQELSEDIKIYVKNNSSYDLSRFIFAINHPNRAKMHEANKDNLSDKSCLKRNASSGDWDCAIMFEHPFLPYQGFELKWDLQNH